MTVQVKWQRLSPEEENKAPIDEFNLSSCEDTLAFRQGGCLILSIIDSGAGMTPDQLARVFHPGVQASIQCFITFKVSSIMSLTDSFPSHYSFLPVQRKRTPGRAWLGPWAVHSKKHL